MQFNTIRANDFHFYKELDAVIQHEPADFVEPETVGLFATIGIKKEQTLRTRRKGWNTIMRLYAPLQLWFAKTWKPGDIEEIHPN